MREVITSRAFNKSQTAVKLAVVHHRNKEESGKFYLDKPSKFLLNSFIVKFIP